MKQKSRLQKFLATVLIVLIISVLGMGVIKRTSYYESADRNFFSFISMLRYGLVDYPVETLGSIASDSATMWDVRYENDMLRRELEGIHHWKARVQELENELEELKEMNELQSLYSDYTLINGQIRARSLEQWDQVVSIDLGSKQGVEVGDGVVSNQGLVGRVIKVQQDSSLVSLLTANNEYSEVSVKIQINDKQTVPGILTSYDTSENLFSIKLLESRSTITEDMVVTTSGQGGVYPSGLYVGKVKSIKKVPDSVGVIVYMESEQSFHNLRYISVVKKP
ncbi:rod shape-determining protein MreC [Erysipelothrix urinaevulpis]|uniref:rod shape-determining protein MreC n=1 Tax=Erysipelothrix urinaevulpis TaxID=2683717 RepID=UPI00135BAF23|nr:rod shape-determining protein MreC [Erysipelothrix urinaevulpis]